MILFLYQPQLNELTYKLTHWHILKRLPRAGGGGGGAEEGGGGGGGGGRWLISVGTYTLSVITTGVDNDRKQHNAAR